MSHDRITQLRIGGLRVIRELTLDLRGLTVLIGDNGTGKSSIIEALELLRKAAKPIAFVPDVINKAHGGLRSLLRRGSDELRLGVTIEGAGPRIDYDFTLGLMGTEPVVSSERLVVATTPDATLRSTLDRHGKLLSSSTGAITNHFHSSESLQWTHLALPHLRTAPDFDTSDIVRLSEALQNVEVHVPFETRPLWQQRELELRVGPRWPATVERSEALDRYALNLPNAFQQLRNLGDEAWNRVIERARLGIGEDLRNFRLPPSGRGNIELEVVFGSAPDDPMPAEYLSEGQLSYLAFIALVELNARRSILAFDEPEVHLNPSLLSRVVWMLEEASETAPVLLSTHSDRLLDTLADPARSVVLCDLDETRSMQIRRVDPDRLADWLQSYRGLGSVRAEGYASHVFGQPSSVAKAEP